MPSSADGARPSLPASSHCSGASGSDAAAAEYTWTSAKLMDVITCAAEMKRIDVHDKIRVRSNRGQGLLSSVLVHLVRSAGSFI
jgi:hypothetical protein